MERLAMKTVCEPMCPWRRGDANIPLNFIEHRALNMPNMPYLKQGVGVEYIMPLQGLEDTLANHTSLAFRLLSTQARVIVRITVDP